MSSKCSRRIELLEYGSLDDSFKQGDQQPNIGSESFRSVQIPQFLPNHERDALYQAACENQQVFHSPGTDSETESVGTYYLSLESKKTDGAGVGAVRAASEFLTRHILKQLPTIFATLSVEPFDVSEISLTLINGLDGHCGTPHADSLDGRFKVSLLYYFHRMPKAFRGGDLEFYDTDAETPTGHSKEPVARIDQADNLLIAFPSQTFHGITDVQCDSSDFADGRFVAVAFLGP